MDWSNDDVSRWLIDNEFSKYVAKFKEEEIDGLSLLNLSPTSIEELLSIITDDNVIKKPTIGLKTTFNKKLIQLKENVFSNHNTIMTLNEKQSDILIEQLRTNQSNNLSFFDDFRIDNDNDSIDQQHSLTISSSDLNTSSSSFDQIPTITTSPLSREVLPDRIINQTSSDSAANSLPQLRKKFPLNYVLPSFSRAFVEAAEDPSLANFGPRCTMKQQLVKTIRDDVVNTYGIGFYPTAYEFDRMVVSVKNKIPTLTKIFGEDMSVLTSALKQQFSRDRKASSCLSEVLEKKRQSYGHQSSGRKLKFIKLELASRREYIVEENQQQQELLMQLYQQAESMRVMINTTNYDYSQVKSKMDATYSHRKQLVQEMKPFKDIVELYPALAITNLLIREINLRCDPFGGDIVKTLTSVCTKLIKYVDHPRKEDVPEEEQPFFILEHLIMKRFKHSKKLLLNHEVIDAHPMIQVQSIDKVKDYAIIIEYNRLISTNSQVEAMAILIGSYEIFDIEYPSKIRATLEVLNGLSFTKRSFCVSLAAKRFLNGHKTKRDDVVEINCTTDQQQKVEKFLVNVKKHFNVKDVKIVDADSSKKDYYIQFETPFEAKMVKMMNFFAEEFSAILKDGSELSII
ncbi:unnamed protein product [Rotaria sordida]|uniref:SAM domain-containing protein n=1 Tax=Rotaria sordida TaxID=392033 RepID=A0A815KDF6_9BILA|nr:unnamed protein product [Rotaria sordida]